MANMFSRDERQQHIIDAARQLFIMNGVEKTSVNDIIKELGIAKGTFYWYFESKEQLIHMVVADVINESYVAADEICHLPDLSFAQKIARILDDLFIENYIGEDLERCIQKEYEAFSDQIWQENIRQLTPIVKRLLAQAVKEDLVAEVCSDEVAAFIIYGFRSILFMKLSMSSEANIKQVNQVMDFVFRGLGFYEPLPCIAWQQSSEKNK